MAWGGIAAAALAFIAAMALFVFQRRHHQDLLSVLGSCVDQRVRVGIAVDGSRSTIVAPFWTVIGAVDSRTRWVTFRSIELDPEGLKSKSVASATAMSGSLAETGLVADRIRWVDLTDGSRAHLN